MCLNSHSSTWVERLEQEMRCHKYTVFFTLTYSEETVPTMIFSYEDSSLYSVDGCIAGLYVDVSYLSDYDLNYLSKVQTIKVLCKTDIQLFMKRLRKAAVTLNKNSKYAHKQDKIRYYIAGEYGPTTLRPHYHGLLFFDSDITAENIDTLLCNSWYSKSERSVKTPNGFIDWSFAENKSASYVAKYVNCFSHLPAVYENPELRPFTLFSKRPPLGSLVIPTEEICKCFHFGITTLSLYDRTTNSVNDVPLWRSIKDRLFPKIRGFVKLSTPVREVLYGLSKYYNCEEWQEFKSKVSYIRDTCPAFEKWLIDSEYLYSDSEEINPKGWNGINKLFRVSRRVVEQAQIFGCTVRYYVGSIEQFYSRLDYQRLVSQLRFEQEFLEKYPNDGSYLLGLDTTAFYKMLMDSTGKYKSLLLSYNVEPQILDSDDSTKITYFYQHQPFMHLDFRALKSLQDSIYLKNSKTKKKNDYLLAHPEYQYLTF